MGDKNENNNVSWFRIIIIVFIFLAGIALARAEMSLRGVSENKVSIATLAANYANIKELLNKLDGKMDIVLGVRK